MTKELALCEAKAMDHADLAWRRHRRSRQTRRQSRPALMPLIHGEDNLSKRNESHSHTLTD